ncbi:hypothetical protein BO70DRAFT_44057 [Aspergillus heteromorphus CBS 117.55]|uniref:Uncharacterized protein n=1 Tax=Aspergillus heteromorphus CBS 117.55 TaxID=1448321 RepID=A0A317W9N9_9EURO|nr:uncharacterized protein BO70DRAFT_44057 [Aspergillus heteromorphus CBS 117.55]PWY81992.1 hypothetical protein BO70DRAFT_44057 [Aspergillus heteromorphus CBS 117.55]
MPSWQVTFPATWVLRSGLGLCLLSLLALSLSDSFILINPVAIDHLVCYVFYQKRFHLLLFCTPCGTYVHTA